MSILAGKFTKTEIMRRIKNLCFVVSTLLLLSMLPASAQSGAIREGSILVLGKAGAEGYGHIEFPRKNFIRKRGALADYQRLSGIRVEVIAIRDTPDGPRVTLRRTDGGKFFRFYSQVEARLDDAMEAGELKEPR